MKAFFLCFVAIFIISCSSSQDKTFSRVNVDKYYRETGVIRYFLPTLPDWANVSEHYGCHRKKAIQYLNVKNVKESFNLSYMETLQLQYIYNVELMMAEERVQKKASPTAEEKLFFKAFDSIKAGNYLFKTPTYKRVNFILVDSFSNDIKKLKELMRSSDMFEGRPVFFSECMRRNELIMFLKDNNVALSGGRFLSYEVLSPYDSEAKLVGKEELNLSKFFSKKQTIFLYYTNQRPKNLKGRFKLKKQ